MSELRILGPLEIAGGDGVVRPSAAKQRRLLAALALADGRAWSTDELVEAVWAGSPPASARKLLQVYVSQLRRLLPDGLAIVTRSSGYQLDLGTGSLDAVRFELLLDDAAVARREGNPALALSLADQALALWRGPAYADVAYDEFARGEAERLEERRLDAVEERLEAQLELGRHAEALGELLALAAEHPLRERLQTMSMLALYRSGRQSAALELYADLRRRLDDELGLQPGAELRELQRRILNQDATLDVGETSAAADETLPEPPNALVGRERELEQLTALLRSRRVRLLVLTGAGGSGKTRLALEAARTVASSYANGAALVELAPLREPELVVPTIAALLGVPENAERPSLDRLAEALRSRELLLVLDNAEHLRPAAPIFVELLARAPRLTLLVTSRAVLHVSGEHVFPVAPLGEDEALALFEQRARSLDPGFTLTEANVDDVRQICRRVDGLPLAVELAAARIRTLTPAVIRERLASRLTLLTGGPRDLPARQQTLRETLDWSAGLLDVQERDVLSRLGVFPGGATLDAAETVCRAGLDTLAALVDHNLVRRVESAGEPRYGLLETIREYADGLRTREVDEDVRRRHAEWCVELAELAEPELNGERQAFWFARLEAEHDNVRAALDELDARGRREEQLRLVVALFRFWYVRGHLAEARRRLTEALAHGDAQPAPLRRRALTAAAAITLLQGDYEASTRFAEDGLSVARETGEDRLVANALSNLGAIVLAGGDETRAAVVLEEAVPLARAVGDERILALTLNNLGDVALTAGDYERAEPLFEESLALLRSRGDTSNIARSLFNIGAVDLMLGRHEDARERFAESLSLSEQTGDKEDLAWCLEGIAGLAAATGDGERAALLLGAAHTLLEGMGAAFKPFERRLHEQTIEAASRLCGPEAFADAFARGTRMTPAETLEVAGP